MRRFFAVLFALLICMSAVTTVFAAEGDFVPSIEYKDGPIIISGFLGEEDVTKCLVITTIEAAYKENTDVSPENRELLLSLYEQLTRANDPMKLPLNNDYTIVELFDISYHYSSCQYNRDHGFNVTRGGVNNMMLTVELQLNFDLDSNADIFTYTNGQWREIQGVQIKDNGVISFVMEALGPVAIAVPQGYTENPPQTGDQMGNNLVLWVVLMAASAVALLAVAVLAKRKTR